LGSAGRHREGAAQLHRQFPGAGAEEGGQVTEERDERSGGVRKR
jgi:hypothetical protein